MSDEPGLIRLIRSFLPTKETIHCSSKEKEETISILIQSTDKSCTTHLTLRSTNILLQPELEVYRISICLQNPQESGVSLGDFLDSQGNFPTEAIVAIVPSTDDADTSAWHGLDRLVDLALSVSQSIVNWAVQARSVIKYPLFDILSAPDNDYKQLPITHQTKLELLSQNTAKLSKRLCRSCVEITTMADHTAIDEKIREVVNQCNVCTRAALIVMKNYQDSIASCQSSLFASSGESSLLHDIARKLQMQLFIYQVKLKALLLSPEVSDKLFDLHTLETLLIPISSFYDHQITRQAIFP